MSEDVPEEPFSLKCGILILHYNNRFQCELEEEAHDAEYLQKSVISLSFLTVAQSDECLRHAKPCTDGQSLSQKVIIIICRKLSRSSHTRHTLCYCFKCKVRIYSLNVIPRNNKCNHQLEIVLT